MSFYLKSGIFHEPGNQKDTQTPCWLRPIVACESNLRSVLRSSMPRRLGEGGGDRARSRYCARAAHAFSARIICRHCTLSCMICYATIMLCPHFRFSSDDADWCPLEADRHSVRHSPYHVKDPCCYELRDYNTEHSKSQKSAKENRPTQEGYGTNQTRPLTLSSLRCNTRTYQHRKGSHL